MVFDNYNDIITSVASFSGISVIFLNLRVRILDKYQERGKYFMGYIYITFF